MNSHAQSKKRISQSEKILGTLVFTKWFVDMDDCGCAFPTYRIIQNMQNIAFDPSPVIKSYDINPRCFFAMVR